MTDLGYALRTLRRSPGLLLVGVLSIGLGVGANLTLFGAIRAVFFHVPTVAAPERVVGVEPGNSNQFSYLNYRDLRDSGIFEAVAGYRRVQLTLRGSDGTDRLPGLALGVAGTLLLRGAIESQLYEVDAYDPMVLSAVSLVLVIVAGLACLVPARRAVKTEPSLALAGVARVSESA